MMNICPKVGDRVMFACGPEMGSIAFGARVTMVLWKYRPDANPPDMVMKEVWVVSPFRPDETLRIPASFMTEILV